METTQRFLAADQDHAAFIANMLTRRGWVYLPQHDVWNKGNLYVQMEGQGACLFSTTERVRVWKYRDATTASEMLCLIDP